MYKDKLVEISFALFSIKTLYVPEFLKKFSEMQPRSVLLALVFLS